MCNRDVKFGAFYDYAMSKGADFIATGHYAQVEHPGVLKNTSAERGVRENVPPRSALPVEQCFSKLLCGIDPDKDQSYFLWAISKEALEKTLFPLGGYKKTEVRALAKHFNLPVAEKKDSQGICFLGAISVDDFLRAEFGAHPGVALDETGMEVGKHDGALLRTLGERVALAGSYPGPWYVVKKDIQKNILMVSNTRTLTVPTHGITLTHTNWLSPLVKDEIVEAQYRYHGPRIGGIYVDSEHTFHPSVPLQEPVAEGQSLVLYHGEECLGGGIIT
jgi:tRNA-specific 2-thiouridylase